MGWRSRLAAWLDPQAARDAREFRLLKRGESLEFPLQRRIHKQRVRLRQLEMWKHYPDYRWQRWMETALRIGREKRDLERQLRKE